MSSVVAFTFELPAISWPYCILNNAGDVKTRDQARSYHV